MNALPWITCVCVSKNRPGFLKKAIEYFQGQTYPRKDMVIVHEGTDAPGNSPAFDQKNITIIEVTPEARDTLGERRNMSIENARGDYFCQWDDDDWYHNRRLEIQMSSLLESGKPAGVLNRLVLYDRLNHRGYLSTERHWEGTLLCKTEIICDFIKYPKVNINEDNSLVVNLIKRDCVHSQAIPFLYVYVYHGNNTWDRSHFQQLFHAGYKLGQTSTGLIKKIVNNTVGYKEASDRIQRLKLDMPPRG